MPRQARPMGESWWAQRWLETLAGFGADYASRLARGRSYALNGRVWQAEVRPGMVTARVQGSFVAPYKVEIEIAPLGDAAWERVIARLASRAGYAANLLAGEMPQDIELVFAQAGTHLFPQTPYEIGASCTCLDWARPCKHVAAVHYLLATNLDVQPTLLFTLRGRTIEQVVAALRARWAEEITPSVPGTDGQEGADGASGEDQPARETMAPLRAGGFFQAGADLDGFQVTIAPPQVEGALLKRLGMPPFVGEHEDPLPVLLRAYSAVTARALQAQGRSGEAKPTRRKGASRGAK